MDKKSIVEPVIFDSFIRQEGDDRGSTFGIMFEDGRGDKLRQAIVVPEDSSMKYVAALLRKFAHILENDHDKLVSWEEPLIGHEINADELPRLWRLPDYDQLAP